MSLFPIWRGELIIPGLPERKYKAGSNFIIQKPFSDISQSVDVFDAQIPGYYTLKTDMHEPFREILVRKKGSRRIDTEKPVLLVSLDESNEFSNETILSWDQLGDLKDYISTPEQVVSNWTNKFLFKQEDDNRDLQGLRLPQIGALHALSAHFAVGEDFEPATVVLPTGTGKTETMLAQLVYHQIPKVIVIVPSDTLRNQISEKFLSLGILPKVGVVPVEIARPFVTKLKKGIQSPEEAKTIISSSNVIVTLPDTISASSDEAVKILLSECTDLIVDEAHHIVAPKWYRIKEAFLSKRITQYTATPFRRDKKRIDGKIIFNFKLGDAQKLDYYRPINLKTVEEYGSQDDRDYRIAIEAVDSLRRDREELKLDHLLLARVRTTKRAEQVISIYRDIAPDYNPQVIYSGPGRTNENRIALEQLLDRGESGSRIIVCVDMLGEGFDLPNLKVAALHDVHKSLAITLQFIGRFTRKGTEGAIGEATVIANIADPETEQKLTNLYAEGADWDLLIKRLSEERIEDEIRLQDLVEGLKQNGNLHSQLSLWNLRPSLSTQIYKTKVTSWTPTKYENLLPEGSESWYAFNEENNTLVAVIYRTSPVRWGTYQNLNNTSYDLLLAHFNKQEQALFIYASDYNGLYVEKIAKEITNDKTELLNGPAIFNILNNVELPLAKNLGSSRIGAISFTSYFGPNVTEGLASIEKAEAELNNIVCLGYEDGSRVLWGGAKRKGKVWQQASAPISEWIQWCSKTWSKVSDEDKVVPNITRDFLRPEKLSKLHTSIPIAVQWGEQVQMSFSNNQAVLFEADEFPIFLVDLDLVSNPEDDFIAIQISTDSHYSVYQFKINAELTNGYEYTRIEGPPVYFRRNVSTIMELEEYLQLDPFIIRYVDGTHSYNCYHIPVKLNAGTYDRDKLEGWKWNNIPLNHESMHKRMDKNTIQYRTFEYISDDYDLIFNDDGTGEAADIVALKDTDDNCIKLALIHCKGAKKSVVSNEIENFYTVCGQAQKSVTVKHCGFNTLYSNLKRRHEIWAKEGFSRFLKGDMKLLSYFKEKARKSTLDFEVCQSAFKIDPFQRAILTP